MNNLFENINASSKEKLLKILEATILVLPKNANIFKAINDTNIIGIIECGSIQIIKNDYNGNRTIVDTLEDNNIFGSIIYPISNQEYEIITKEKTKLIVIDYNIIMNYNETNHSYYNQFIKNLLKVIVTKGNEKNDRIEILTKRTIRDKLLEYFKINSQRTGSKIVYLPFTFTELADYLAVDRCAMSREMKYLKEEGFISISNKKITLLY